jgi:amphi-Trp domain-containing protein
MATQKKKREREVEMDYPMAEFVKKLRRLADAIEQNKRFQIQVAGQRISIPARARINIAHERDDESEEIEFQITWPVKK